MAELRLLGQIFSLALTTIVLSLIVGRQAIVPANYDLFLRNIHMAFVLSTLLCLTGVYLPWFRGTMLQSKE